MGAVDAANVRLQAYCYMLAILVKKTCGVPLVITDDSTLGGIHCQGAEREKEDMGWGGTPT